MSEPGTKKKSLILVGGGGHAKVVIDAIKKSGNFDIYGIADPFLKPGISVMGVPVIGSDKKLKGLLKKGISKACISIGSVGDCERRIAVFRKLKKMGYKFPAIIHPSAVIGNNVRIGEGSFVASGAVINPGTRIGRNAIINTRSSIDHDCEIGNFVHIAPGCVLSGSIRIGEGTHIGTGARIVNNINIGRNCFVAAGSIVTKSLKDGERFFKLPLQVSSKKKRRVFIIAEAGVNHNGSVKTAKKMIDSAKLAGADAVKFQTFEAENLVTKSASKAGYQKISTGKKQSQYGMIKKLELNADAYKKLMQYCGKKGIAFISSPFDLKSINLLERLKLEVYKIPSGEITNFPYLEKIGRLKKKIIMSTGMATLGEIKDALKILTLGGTKKKNITVLHCNTEYPTSFKDVNLKAMLAIKDAFNIGVGYSDHTLGIEVAVAAVTLGAEVIEKHFTLDKNMQGPDHAASLEPEEFKKMVDFIRNIEAAFGSGTKRPSASEQKNKEVIRKSIVAARDIKKGEVLQCENITSKRPASGISPMKWNMVIGRKAVKDFRKDEFIRL